MFDLNAAAALTTGTVGTSKSGKVRSLETLSEKAGTVAAIMHKMLKDGDGVMSASACLAAVRKAGLALHKDDKQLLSYIKAEKAWIQRTQGYTVEITA